MPFCKLPEMKALRTVVLNKTDHQFQIQLPSCTLGKSANHEPLVQQFTTVVTFTSEMDVFFVGGK